jgi:prepilin-type N-terminal cleavage/methylation domain-containing protein
MRRIARGFTIIELLVVISVIGILATITLVGFNRYQADSRDAQRSSQATILAEALEKYYDKNGEYPSCTAVTDVGTNVVTNVLVGTDPEVLIAPQAAPNQTNSIDFCTEITPSTPTDSFAYVGDGSSTCTSGNSCLQFSIQYKEESTGTIKTITSRRTTDIATSGGTSLTGNSVSASQINVSWDAIPNASSYELVRATNVGFTTGVSTSNPVSNAENATGLNASTQYWFRVRAISAGGNSEWSNTFTATTRPAAPTNVVATTASSSQVNITWTAVSGATSYRVQRSTTSDYQSGTTASASGLPGPSSHSQTGLAPGTQYWFRVYASNSAGESAASSIDNAITTLATPTGFATTVTSTSIDVSWSAVTNATAYDVQYSTSASFSPITGSFNNQTATSRNITGLSIGQTYYIRVFAENAVTQSAAGSTSATTTPPAPVCGATAGSTNTQIVPDWDAATGATSYTVQYGPNNYATEITGITGTYVTINGLNNGTTYTSRVQAVAGSAASAWTNCPNRTTGIDSPGGGWFAHAEAVRASCCISWMPGAYPGGGNWWTNGIETTATCSAGATVVSRLHSYYANSSNGSQTQHRYDGWSVGNMQRFVVNGTGGYHVWWNGWIGCQVGGTRVERYLGNAGYY